MMFTLIRSNFLRVSSTCVYLIDLIIRYELSKKKLMSSGMNSNGELMENQWRINEQEHGSKTVSYVCKSNAYIID